MTTSNLISHYTSFEAFKSIIESQCIWATNVMFLNDHREYNHCYQLFWEVFSNFREGLCSESSLDKHFIEGVNRSLHDMGEIGESQHCIASFSENIDQLSQWRGYGSVGIVFDSSKLQKYACNNNSHYVTFKKCQYNEKILQKEIAEIITQIYADYKKVFSKNKEEIFTLIIDLQMYLYNQAAFIKDSGFAEEAEIRLSCGMADEKAIKFRSTPSNLVPYIEIPFNLDAIEFVMIGPNINPKRAEQSIAMFLNRHFGKKGPKIRHSKIPYRAW